MPDPNPYRPTQEIDLPPPKKKGLLEFSWFEKLVGYTSLTIIAIFMLYTFANALIGYLNRLFA
ncbi:hypothetical protein NHH03_26795 [Stieleria sp. TO1_6]|uniref:hypothetical protein n=1 Tax=Stieleria tagensis TaxID=2956795 RepID=UPI00209B9E0E|nr:hypothetical protein [Stieleria tagensis]MCO8125376.1 hypothetical protein [Stieleria tagensis]